jgi:predicted Rossmann fold flavoprotein
MYMAEGKLPAPLKIMRFAGNPRISERVTKRILRRRLAATRSPQQRTPHHERGRPSQGDARLPLANNNFDATILGGGAAGLMCAIEAAKRGRRVAVLERGPLLGRKILISGGGRCNFTNLYCKPEHFLSANPHFAKSALARYQPSDFIALLDKHGVHYHEKTLGQLFCNNSAREVLNVLEQECRMAGVTILLNQQVRGVNRSTSFTVETDKGEFHSAALVVATGGLSIPKMGATSSGYELARQFGHSIHECRPALVPLLFDRPDRERYSDLSGVSTAVVASFGKQRFAEKLLITHRGLSGPAVLQISSYWDRRNAITFDLVPGTDVTSPLRERPSGRDLAAARGALRNVLPKRLADRWADLYAPVSWTNQSLARTEYDLHHWEVKPCGTEGYEKAEVTAGGVDTKDLSAKTMESVKVPGLFFIGEVVDVTGHLGGFNFQWAWASGFCTGNAI